MGNPSAGRRAVNASLYDRLGGAAAVAALVDDAVDRHAANPALAPLFQGKDLPQLKASEAKVFGARVGGPAHPEAADPALRDGGMHFSPAELRAVAGDMTAAPREQGIGAADVGEVVRSLHACCTVAPIPRRADDQQAGND
jgi:hemoglobin